ncbi:MAG: C40 family peptidase [Oscillibacter sp.]|nr:C40 family peptidase [Oscillibacter sp.]
MHSIKMKGLLYITAALTILLCVGTANAEGVGVATISADGLRLRAEPNTEAKVLTTASNGSRAIVLGDAQDGWYPVSYHAEEGYMSAEYLDVVYETEADLGSGLVKTSGSTLNIRSGPGTDYERVTAVRNGAVVKLTGIKDGWFKVEYNGAQGYMLSDYVVPCEESEAAALSAPAFSADASAAAQEILTYAAQYLGAPYVYGGNGPNSFDCSGFTSYVYRHFGYKINRTASTQLQNGVSVPKDQLQPGDLVFFRNGGDSHPASHVGIYVGNNQYIHAASDTGVVEYRSLLTAANLKKYVGARRLLS